jgi:pyridoxamine 5'-phosphate oxidase
LSFDLSQDPFVHFDHEYSKAQAAIKKDPTAMFLATSSKQGIPTLRTVLFKGIVRGGFSFYTNYGSPKSHDLDENPRASLLFFWPLLSQQIRIEGLVWRLTRAESEAYFATRDRLSQIGAWASKQSEKISGSEELHEQVKQVESQFQGKTVPCPPFWGGWHVLPLQIEFWFAHEGRLHDRFVFSRKEITANQWDSFMVSP